MLESVVVMVIQSLGGNGHDMRPEGAHREIRCTPRMDSSDLNLSRMSHAPRRQFNALPGAVHLLVAADVVEAALLR